MAGRMQRLREMAGVAVLLTWETPEWVSLIVAWVAVAALQAAFLVGRFPRDLERVRTIRGFVKMSQVPYDTAIQKSTDLLGSAVLYGMLAGGWLYAYHHTTGRTKECSMWITGIFVSIAFFSFLPWALVALMQVVPF
jgi:hypothetical protein